MTAAVAFPVNPSFFQRLAGLDQAQKLRLALGVVLFVAIGIVGVMMGRQAEWRVLYANLPCFDAAQHRRRHRVTEICGRCFSLSALDFVGIAKIVLIT